VIWLVWEGFGGGEQEQELGVFDVGGTPERAARAAHVGATAGPWVKMRSSCWALPLALILKQKRASSGGSRAEVKRSGTSLEAAGLASDSYRAVLVNHGNHQNRSKATFFSTTKGPRANSTFIVVIPAAVQRSVTKSGDLCGFGRSASGRSPICTTLRFVCRG